ncbi:HPr family phosphocarrier protein [Paenibacillus cellulositrophicus]|uniref:HPr family phosphocarrier protein n=1 Tax=Paenibacillus cellulositrophicus TaxID=562959 RepID=UPI003F816559
MITQTVTIRNKQGFHVRPAQQFSDRAGQYEAQVAVVTEDGRRADGKSMLELMTLGLEVGSVVTIEAAGPGDEEAVRALVELVDGKFGED